jgi:hypothetical protein
MNAPRCRGPGAARPVIYVTLPELLHVAERTLAPDYYAQPRDGARSTGSGRMANGGRKTRIR